jgi:hemolysin activation/secretion protein
MTFFNRIVASLILTCVCAAANAQAVLPEAKPSYDAGRELNRTLRDLQKTRIERDLEKQIDESASEEKATVPSSSGDQQLPEVTVFLKKIEFSPSAVIPEAELRTIAAEYENRQAGMAQLYEMLDRVNLWYRTRGYVTAMAVLPPQKLGDGILKVTLIEGKVGRVLIEGNKTTRDEYVRNRIAVPAGKLLSIDSLNRDLVWFNGSNDVKLKVKLQAGEVRETTDYHIFVFEPADSSCCIF